VGLDQRFEHFECGDLDAIAESEFVASGEFLNGREEPHQKLIVRLDRRARTLGIVRHRGLSKNSTRGFAPGPKR
jgi:hypothetical protein